jgi:hypothetical protein
MHILLSEIKGNIVIKFQPGKKLHFVNYSRVVYIICHAE